MSCSHYYAAPPAPGDPAGETVFSVEPASVSFGRGALDEVGARARGLGLSRVALFTDRTVGALPHAARVLAALRGAGLDVAVFDAVRVEPDDASLIEAARFVRGGRFDGLVSLGGGSVMDPCKAASLLASYPADLLTYVNPPIGAGVAPPGPLRPHIACPTTSGTGSECTGIAVCGLPAQRLKTGISHRALRPTLALVDPACTETLPAAVVAASGFDVLCHALESYTARPYTRRPRPATPADRPLSQGANPLSDLGSLEALRLCGRYLLRAVRDATDREARDQMMYAALLAGIAFGNSGVHVPHAMAYAAAARLPHPAGAGPGYCLPPYPAGLLPHGLSVVLCAPAAVALLAPACPERHLRCAEALGLDVRDVPAAQAGALLARGLTERMRELGLPTDLAALGYGAADVAALAESTGAQGRLLNNAPRPVTGEDLQQLFAAALGAAHG